MNAGHSPDQRIHRSEACNVRLGIDGTEHSGKRCLIVGDVAVCLRHCDVVMIEDRACGVELRKSSTPNIC